MLKAIPNMAKKILIVLTAALFVVSMMFFALPGKVYGATIINVGPGQTYSTIQAAINAAGEGDIINVATGEYNEVLTIEKANLTIKGAGKDNSIIRGGSGSYVVEIFNTTGVTFSGFTIEANASGPYYGLKLYNSDSCNVSNLKIQNISPTSGNPKGIELLGSSSNSFSDIDIININSPSNMAYGVYIQQTGSTKTGFHYADNNTFKKLNISNVTSNTASGYYAYGFWVEGASGNSLTDSIISGISGQYTCGVYLEDAENNVVARNQISDITGGSYGAFGIMLNILNADHGSNLNSIESNTISGLESTGTGSTFGTYLWGSSNNTIKGNDISGANVGIGIAKMTYGISQDSSNNTVESCTITGNTLGVSISDSSRNKINNNNISGNKEYGVTANVEVDATHNWWGDESGPSGGAEDPVTGAIANGSGDAVSDNVNFDPWEKAQIGSTPPTEEEEEVPISPAAPTPSAAQKAVPTDYVKQTVEAGIVTVDATDIAGAYATVAGSGGQTVTIKEIPIDAALEQGFLVEGATKYVDLHLDSAQGIEKIEFTILGVSGIPKYWNGSSWIECSDYTIDAAGNVTVTITDTTIPSLADLTGTIFTVVPEPKTVRTHEMTCWQVYVNDNNNFEFIFLWEYKNNNWISIYDSQENLVYRKSFPYGSPIVEVDLPDGTYTVKTFHEEGNILQEFTIAK